MMSARTQRITEVLKRGDQYVQEYSLFCPNLDFTGATIRAHVRTVADGTLLASATITKDNLAVGSVSGKIRLDGSVTATLPPRCVMELEAHHPTESWGPFTPIEIWLEVQADYTHG